MNFNETILNTDARCELCIGTEISLPYNLKLSYGSALQAPRLYINKSFNTFTVRFRFRLPSFFIINAFFFIYKIPHMYSAFLLQMVQEPSGWYLLPTSGKSCSLFCLLWIIGTMHLDHFSVFLSLQSFRISQNSIIPLFPLETDGNISLEVLP